MIRTEVYYLFIYFRGNWFLLVRKQHLFSSVFPKKSTSKLSSQKTHLILASVLIKIVPKNKIYSISRPENQKQHPFSYVLPQPNQQNWKPKFVPANENSLPIKSREKKMAELFPGSWTKQIIKRNRWPWYSNFFFLIKD